MSTLHTLSFGLAVAAGLSAGACAAPSAAPERSTAREVAAPVDHVRSERLPSQFDAGGVVRGRAMAVISSRLLAPVVSVHVRAGDVVRVGQLLVTLDDRDLQSQAARTAAALAAARASVHAAESEKAAAEAAAAQATTSFDRIRVLRDKRSATPQEFDDAQAGAEAARARSSAAAAHVSEATEALAAANEAAKAAAITASYGTLTAPFGRQITERAVDPGVMAAPGVPLLTLEDTSKYRLEVNLDETRAALVTQGQHADVTLDGSTWFDARVSEVSRLDTRHGFVAKIDVPPGPAPRPGMFGRARFQADTRDSLTVPASALVRRGQMTFVFVVDGDRVAHLRPVSSGAAAGDRHELLAGATAGETVVVAPPPTLNDGDRVVSVQGVAR